MTSYTHPLAHLSYSGTARGVTFQCSPARAKGKMSIDLTRENSDGFKGVAHRLLDALNARWSRQSGYVLSPTRATQWRALFVAGWDAEFDFRGAYGHRTPPMLESPDGRKVTLAEAVKEVGGAETH